MRWLECGVGNVHLIGPCPECYETRGGLLVGTEANNYTGRVTTLCIDCGKEVDYYIDSHEKKVWKLEPIESKGAHLEGAPVQIGVTIQRDTHWGLYIN